MASSYKTIFLAFAVCTCAVSNAKSMRLQFNDPRMASIIRMKVGSWRPDGYNFEYETSLGSKRKEIGYIKKTSDGREFLVTEGAYSYIGPDFRLYQVKYKADENGYHPFQTSTALSRSGTPSADVDSDNIVFPSDDYDDSRGPTKTTFDFPTSTNPSTDLRTSQVGNAGLGEGLDDRFLPPDVVGSLLG